eukprot:TRINITY_DN2727_c0_g2_i3.p1 TRINITY_DN2727_c0_g2~~TRINITY_DN2727_c0_g2_i3.p1  ORF type:complete len:435 (+),score=89.97 TRINITY_DN2727_c0_g2_i3:164-1468(+)
MATLFQQYFWAGVFGLWYISMTTVQSFYNKQVFSTGFNLPISLCFCQMLGTLFFLVAGQTILQTIYPFAYKQSNLVNDVQLSKQDAAVVYRLNHKDQTASQQQLQPAMFNTDRFWERTSLLTMVAFCLAVNIVLTNWSLYRLDLNIFIVLRSTTIVWIVVLGYFILGHTVSRVKIMACSLVLLGSLAVAISFTKNAPTKGGHTMASKAIGVLFCLCSTVANGFMLIFMKRVLSVTSKTTPTPLNDETNPNNPNNPTSNTPINPINPINPTPSSPINNNNNNNNNNNDLEDPTLALPPLKFEKFDFLFYQSINCAAVLGLFALLLEGKDLIGMLSGDEAWSIIRVLANSSFMSIFYQLSLIGLVKNTTPLSKEVISQSKIVPQTVLAIVLFNEHYSSTTILGLFVAVCGLALYSYVTMSEDKKVITTKTPTKHNE